MTANQQFTLALLGLLVAPIVTLVSLWFTRKTYHQVNSRMDEYKSVLAVESKKAVDTAVQEMKRLLSLESAVQVAAKMGPAGETGPIGATGATGKTGATGAPGASDVIAATADTVEAAKRAAELAKKTNG